MARQKQYYVFARPDTMRGHKFTDDVALCKAVNHNQAKKIFSRYYTDIKDDEVWCLTPKKHKHTSDVIILTDY